MIDKSALRKSIKITLDEHEVEGNAILDDVMDALVQEFSDDIYDDEEDTDEDEDEAPGFLGD